jgi:hypothetical protein
MLFSELVAVVTMLFWVVAPCGLKRSPSVFIFRDEVRNVRKSMVYIGLGEGQYLVLRV